MWKRNIRSRLIARCFGFPFHNFLTGSGTQKFRVSAYRRINKYVLFNNFVVFSGDYVRYAFGLVSDYLSLQWSESLKESLR